MSDLYILIGVCYFPRNVHLCSLNIKYITIQATNQPKTNYDCALANRKPTNLLHNQQLELVTFVLVTMQFQAMSAKVLAMRPIYLLYLGTYSNH